MHPSMQYKTPFDISNNVINYNGEYLNIGANFIDKITYVGTDTVYDILMEHIAESNFDLSDDKQLKGLSYIETYNYNRNEILVRIS